MPKKVQAVATLGNPAAAPRGNAPGVSNGHGERCPTCGHNLDAAAPSHCGEDESHATAVERRALYNRTETRALFGATPDPVPAWWVRGLLVHFGCGQREAARLLRYDPRTVRRWVDPSDGIAPTWAACELLRRILVERGPGAATSARPDSARSPV